MHACKWKIWYCDTDSIVSEFKLPFNLISDNLLGLWKLVDELFYGTCFVAPKFYNMNGRKY